MNDFLEKGGRDFSANEKPDFAKDKMQSLSLEIEQNKLALNYLSKDISAGMTLIVDDQHDFKMFDLKSDKAGRLNQVVKKVIDFSLEDEKDYGSAVKGMKDLVATLTPEEAVYFKSQYEVVASIAKRNKITEVILNSKALTDNPKMREALLGQVDLLVEEFKEGRIDRREYLKEMDTINMQVVDSVPEDKELKKALKVYEAIESSYDSMIYSFETKEAQKAQAKANNDLPITEEKEVSQAFNELKIGGIKFDISKNNTAKVICGNEFEVDVSVYRNTETNEPVYYIADKYSKNGFVRVGEDELLETVDDRYVDSYLTTKLIEFYPKAKETFTDVPDEKLIGLAKRIVGKGEERNFTIEGESRTILDNFVKLLNVADSKHPNFEKKLEALEFFMSNGEKVKTLREKLVKNNSISALTVSEAIEQ